MQGWQRLALASWPQPLWKAPVLSTPHLAWRDHLERPGGGRGELLGPAGLAVGLSVPVSQVGLRVLFCSEACGAEPPGHLSPRPPPGPPYTHLPFA